MVKNTLQDKDQAVPQPLSGKKDRWKFG